MGLDPRIGMLNGGRFYCFPDGYGMPELVGGLAEVEAALGLRSETEAEKEEARIQAPSPSRLWIVTLSFQWPAWDEVDGIEYRDIRADGKAEACSEARLRARADGHLGSGKGRATFKATEM